MVSIGGALEKIPLIPTKRSVGKRLLTRGYSWYRGDADVVGHVMTPGGWELVRANYETDGEDEYYVAVDEDDGRKYPADGLGADPGTLYGIPIAVGYRNFGSVREVPNTKIARDVFLLDSEEETELPASDPEGQEGEDGGADGFFAGLRDRLPSKRESGKKLISKGLALIQGTKLTGAGADADALNLVRDNDGQWALERVDYDVDEGWFESRDSGHPFDPEAIGADPSDLLGTQVGYSLSKYPRMMAAVTPRLGRNMHEGKLTNGEKTYGGQYYNENGEVAVTDGGERDAETDGGMPAPRAVNARHNDIMLEERAFVLPEDVKLLGGNQETTDKIQTAKERVETAANMPGGELGQTLMRYGGIFMGLIMGWWFGSNGGGGGGGGGSAASGGSSSPVPMTIDASPVVDAAMTPAVMDLMVGVM